MIDFRQEQNQVQKIRFWINTNEQHEELDEFTKNKHIEPSRLCLSILYIYIHILKLVDKNIFLEINLTTEDDTTKIKNI